MEIIDMPVYQELVSTACGSAARPLERCAIRGHKRKAIEEEVAKLLAANFIREALTTQLRAPGIVSFMARPCYVCLKLNMRAQKRYHHHGQPVSEECLQQGSRIADQQMAVLELDEYKKTVDPADLMRSKKPASESAFQSAGETKKVSIHPTDDSAAPTNISTTLDPK
ncbi:hypothetical protein ZWY2020_024609 [Hordeum vulgare]|nr:hypothetical protein ZWY2020_024609 [Hordeum vulgare]